MEPLKVKDRMIVPNFDLADPANMGRSAYFNLDNHIIAVEQLIASDEIEMALKLMDMLPSWHRTNYPDELTRMKKILYENLYDPYEYSSDSDEAGWTKEDAEKQFGTAYTYPRAEILRDVVLHYNAKNMTPWICELSTSHGLLPLGLQREGHKFNFFGKNLNHPALIKLKGWLNDGVWAESPGVDQPKIFVFTEALEHAYREEDLLNSYMKLGIEFDDIILSVPNGTLGHGLPNWKTRRLGHLRTYNSDEFYALAKRYFKGYSWRLWPSVSLVLHGEREVKS